MRRGFRRAERDLPMRFKSGKTGQRGFSLVELLMVVAISLVIAAVAVPNIMRAMGAYRLRSGIHAQAQVIQRARMEAMSANRVQHVASQWNWDGSAWRNFVFLDANGNWMQDANEQVQYNLPSYMYNSWGWGPSTATMNLDFTPQNTWGLPSFDARGIPCQFNSPNDCPTIVGGQPVGFVSYLVFWEDSWWVGSNIRFAAVSVSPTGKMRTYTWDGDSWQQ